MANKTPEYYLAQSGQDVYDVATDFDLNMMKGNVFKYMVRAGKKDPSKEYEDLLKAKNSLDREIARVSKQKDKNG